MNSEENNGNDESDLSRFDSFLTVAVLENVTFIGEWFYCAPFVLAQKSQETKLELFTPLELLLPLNRLNMMMLIRLCDE